MGSVDLHGRGEVGPPATVCGVPLETGERVVLFARPRHARNKMVYVVVGILLAPLGVGFALIAYGLIYQRYNLRFLALTNRRIVLQRGHKPARWLRLAEVVELRAKRAGGTGATIAGPQGVPAPEKTDPRHWAHAQAIVVHGRVGALSIDDSVALEQVGPAIANALQTEGAFDRWPAVNHPS